MKFDICGIGNPIIDIRVNRSRVDLAALSIDRAGKKIEGAGAKEEISCGGSVANSIVAAAQLGAATAYIGCVGKDNLGERFVDELKEYGVTLAVASIAGKPTGICRITIAEDGERSLNALPGAYGDLCFRHIDNGIIAESGWLLLEGYVLFSGREAFIALKESARLARECGCRVAFTLSSEAVIEQFYDEVRQLASMSDLLFGNEKEFCAFSRTADSREAYSKALELVPEAVMTAGGEGVFISAGGQCEKIPAVRCEHVIDTTGAGDMFAGVFLAGITAGLNAGAAARAAAFLASKVVGQYGARLTEGEMRSGWEFARGRGMTPGQFEPSTASIEQSPGPA